MATLNFLKQALRQKAETATPSQTKSLTDAQYDNGFSLLLQGSGWKTYEDFIIPQLSQLIAPFSNPPTQISVLEIGPGPKSILGFLPAHLRQIVGMYTAFEPNGLFAARLEKWLSSKSKNESPLPCLRSHKVHPIRFAPEANTASLTRDAKDKYDIIIFCHSMYGMKPKNKFIKHALGMLVEQPHRAIAVFHREFLELDGLVCHQTASFRIGLVSVADSDQALDVFAPFIAGFAPQSVAAEKAIRDDWRNVCRTLGQRREDHPNCLFFASPEIMVIFNHHATSLSELTAQVPLVKRTVKNREARLNCPASIVRPTNIQQVQQCVQWALKHEVGLTVIGGGHSGHCLWSSVVSIDMSAFDQIHIIKGGKARESGADSDSDSDSLIVVETGCRTGSIVSRVMEDGLILPFGARPSVGAGLWLQGGIGHLARLHGLTCDSIVGALMVCVKSGEILCVGSVPSQHNPAGAVRPKNETDLLWAIKGAGTNFGIIIGVTFKTYKTLTYSVKNWILPLRDNVKAQLEISKFDIAIASKLPRNISADAYLYRDNNKLHLGVTMFECSKSGLTTKAPASIATLGQPKSSQVVDSIGLFDTEMYMSGLHGGHGSSKTSAFKRCLFLKDIGRQEITNLLVAAIENCPSPLSYFHLLQGGGAISDVAGDATAFGCRDWDFACVVTGVWPRDEDGTKLARDAVQWVYHVAQDLLPWSRGVYSADLGLSPRDEAMAAEAFGLNRPRLASLKRSLDPHNVLAYACPLPSPRVKHNLIILVTGDSAAGKDYCADVWVASFLACKPFITARAVSISEVTKREYAKEKGADLNRLLKDRAYKEQHRQALTRFYQEQVQKRPRLPEEHFLDVVARATYVDVLLITGMRDDAPVAAFSHLVPDSRMLDIRVEASRPTLARRGQQDSSRSNSAHNYCPTLIFNNDATGSEEAKKFAERYLVPLVHEDLQRLADMVQKVPDFPRSGMNFRHVVGIAQQPHGLKLCTSLLQTQFRGTWAENDAVVSCEAGGFIFTSTLALQVDLPMVLIRDASKLPPPIISTPKPSSSISSLASNSSKEKRIGIQREVISRGSSVVVVDDVLSTGHTLCAMLHLLTEAGISAENISIIVVAEFPAQRGRAFLRQCGFGKAKVQSLLVFGGA